ncbi:MAG: phosphoribosylanthranilate isomerase [Pseudomonadota bacterium]
MKICGLTSAEAARHAADSGAAYIGLTLFPPSPRSVDLSTASEIAKVIPSVTRVALTVDADNDLIDALSGAGIDMIQLHGKETPARVASVRDRTGLPVMKAIGIRGADDLPAIDSYAAVSDQLLIDAKAPEGAIIPGGNGVVFDWRLIAGRTWPVPWMLAGGLNPENVAEAIRLTGADQVDVASGTETAPGLKDPLKVKDFIHSAVHGRVASTGDETLG